MVPRLGYQLDLISHLTNPLFKSREEEAMVTDLKTNLWHQVHAQSHALLNPFIQNGRLLHWPKCSCLNTHTHKIPWKLLMFECQVWLSSDPSFKMNLKKRSSSWLRVNVSSSFTKCSSSNSNVSNVQLYCKCQCHELKVPRAHSFYMEV